MAKSLKAPGKWHVTSRVVAAFIPGMLFVNTFGIALALTFTSLFNWEKLDAVAFATIWAFAFYGFLVMWIFSVERLRTVWLSLIGGIVFTGGISFGLLKLEGLI